MISRHIKTALLERAQRSPVVALMGPRQSGKTWLARDAFPRHTYFNLDNWETRRRAEQDPRSFLLSASSAEGLIIDEAQNCPALFSELLPIVDEEARPGRFILTGSQSFVMHHRISETLAGRISACTLLPLSIAELAQSGLLPTTVDQLICSGGYPTIITGRDTPEQWFQDYAAFYLDRDIRELDQVGDLGAFHSLIQQLASRIGQVINLSDLASEVAVSDATIKRWISILEASFIITCVRPYHANLGRRVTKAAKVYFIDTGFACALLRIHTSAELVAHPLRGLLFENLIVIDLIKEAYNRRKRPNIYFWRDYDGLECDIVLENGQQLVAIEIKSSQSIRDNQTRTLRHFGELAGIPSERLYLISSGEARYSVNACSILPWSQASSILAPYL